MGRTPYTENWPAARARPARVLSEHVWPEFPVSAYQPVLQREQRRSSPGGHTGLGIQALNVLVAGFRGNPQLTRGCAFRDAHKPQLSQRSRTPPPAIRGAGLGRVRRDPDRGGKDADGGLLRAWGASGRRD